MSQLLNPLWTIRRKDAKRVEGPETKFVEPTYNYPTKLKGIWDIEPISGNAYKCTLITPITLTGGADSQVFDFYFHHRITRWVLLQKNASGARVADTLTWSFDRLIGSDYLTEFSYDSDASHSINIPVDQLNLESSSERYRISASGTATNRLDIQIWLEVLR